MNGHQLVESGEEAVEILRGGFAAARWLFMDCIPLEMDHFLQDLFEGLTVHRPPSAGCPGGVGFDDRDARSPRGGLGGLHGAEEGGGVDAVGAALLLNQGAVVFRLFYPLGKEGDGSPTAD